MPFNFLRGVGLKLGTEIDSTLDEIMGDTVNKRDVEHDLERKGQTLSQCKNTFYVFHFKFIDFRHKHFDTGREPDPFCAKKN